MERALAKAFAYDKMNYLMLMMKDRHTHFHMIPRYSQKKEFAGMVFEDEAWPGAEIYVNNDLSPEILQKVKEEILKNL